MHNDVMLDEKTYITSLGEESLGFFEKVAGEAQGHLNHPGVSYTSIANAGGMNDDAILEHLEKVNHALRENYQQLAKEPAIARVVTLDQEEQLKTFYFCRAGGGICGLVGGRAPLGRLASLDAGDKFQWKDKTYWVLENAKFRPLSKDGVWDSLNTILETEDLGPLTVPSLRKFLDSAAAQGADAPVDLLSALLAEDAPEAVYIPGVQRDRIESMTLRDRPVLDKFQDEIFRLPLNQQLVLLGPPGTGKTTTLIRRLGQKVDITSPDSLTEEERGLLAQSDRLRDHATSWLMFTPTNLLKQYLKEAFNREGVPAPDQRLITWERFQRDVARNDFNILRGGNGKGLFVLREQGSLLLPSTEKSLIPWYEDFDREQRANYLEELQDGVRELLRLSDGPIADPDLSRRLQDYAGKLSQHLNTRGGLGVADVLEAIALLDQDRLQALHDELQTASREVLDRFANLLLNRDRTIFSDLATFLASLNQPADGDPEDEGSTEEDDFAPPSTNQRVAAMRALQGAMRAQARMKAGLVPSSPAKTSRHARILAWLHDRTDLVLDEKDLGPRLLAAAKLGLFRNPAKRYFEGLARRYRTFRRLRQKENIWYQASGFSAQDIHPLEVDMILLTTLRDGSALVRRPRIASALETSHWGVLLPIASHLHNQIMVDEATDFSPIQLACMASLVHPGIRSFFACGDFNQRLTTWGVTSEEAFTWAMPGLEYRKVTISYRQSRQLNDLARAFVELSGGQVDVVNLPKNMNVEGVEPALLEGATPKVACQWVAQRVREIDCMIDKMPSTAVFVNSGAEVGPIAKLLDELLEVYNLRAVPCYDGLVLGQNGDIRVFDIQYIKGLEFEAVFFMSVDRLAEMHPELFDKYLYVGATRAATYLGITCERTLPARLSPIRCKFVDGWDQA